MLVGRAVSATGELLPNIWDAAMSALNTPGRFSQDEEKLTLGRVRAAQAGLSLAYGSVSTRKPMLASCGSSRVWSSPQNGDPGAVAGQV